MKQSTSSANRSSVKTLLSKPMASTSGATTGKATSSSKSARELQLYKDLYKTTMRTVLQGKSRVIRLRTIAKSLKHVQKTFAELSGEFDLLLREELAEQLQQQSEMKSLGEPTTPKQEKRQSTSSSVKTQETTGTAMVTTCDYSMTDGQCSPIARSSSQLAPGYYQPKSPIGYKSSLLKQREQDASWWWDPLDAERLVGLNLLADISSGEHKSDSTAGTQQPNTSSSTTSNGDTSPTKKQF